MLPDRRRKTKSSFRLPERPPSPTGDCVDVARTKGEILVPDLKCATTIRYRHHHAVGGSRSFLGFESLGNVRHPGRDGRHGPSSIERIGICRVTAMCGSRIPEPQLFRRALRVAQRSGWRHSSPYRLPPSMGSSPSPNRANASPSWRVIV